jgi:hypothetical protein
MTFPLTNSLIIEFWRCEQHKTLHFNANQQVWEDLKTIINKMGFNVIERELKPALWTPIKDCNIHRSQEVIRAVFEVQGLEYSEGIDFLFAIESLVAKYAELK